MEGGNTHLHDDGVGGVRTRLKRVLLAGTCSCGGDGGVVDRVAVVVVIVLLWWWWWWC